MTVAEPIREDDDDAARIAVGQRRLVEMKLAALRAIQIPPNDPDARILRGLVQSDLDRMTAQQDYDLECLCWRWRRRISRAFAPRLNPADPLVRAERERMMAHG
jgi:hypothetical protein